MWLANRAVYSAHNRTCIYSCGSRRFKPKKQKIQQRPICREAPASPPCVPWEQTFMKTFPESHYNSIAIPGGSYLHHDCNLCFFFCSLTSPYCADVARWRENAAVGASRESCGEVVVHSRPGLSRQTVMANSQLWQGSCAIQSEIQSEYM